LDNPVMTPFVEVVFTFAPPGLAVTVYPRIAEPPFEAGADHVITAWPLPAVAEAPVGAPGALGGTTGVIGEEELDADDVPALFVAVTVNVYSEPFVKPVTVADVPELVAVAPPGLAVTV
jgi:hypothetical protein